MVQAGAKEVIGGGISEHQNLPETDGYWNSNWEPALSVITPEHQHSCGLQEFCRADDLPKGTDLSVYSQEKLDAIADSLNGLPRKTLNWHSPLQVLAQVLANPIDRLPVQ